jgi:hypothetical protein
MKDRIYMALALAMTVGPAIAQPDDFARIPEPATMTMFGVAAVGGYIARKFFGRK